MSVLRKKKPFTVIRPSVEAKKKRMLKKTLWQSLLILTGVVTWVALFRINEPRALNESWASIGSIEGIFLSLVAILTALFNQILIGKNQLKDEVLIIFVLILLAGLAEAWSLELRPAFLPASTMAFYFWTKIWIKYMEEI